MKLVVLLLTITSLQLSAKGYAQQVTLKVSNVSIGYVLEQVYEQTGYQFVATKDMLKQAHLVSLDIKNAPMKQALELCFEGQPFTYTLNGRVIIVKTKEKLTEATNQVLALIKIMGKVTDDRGNALVGVTIKVKDGTVGSVTDAQGMYSIRVSDNAVLLISYIGYQKREIAVNGRNIINIVLKESVSELNQLVVVGYGSVKRKDLTGSIASIKGSDLDKVPVPDVSQMLEGRAAGLQVTTPDGTPGAGATIKIRGGGSITQSNEPLYVIDGFPETDGLSFLDPQDIASIEVLKDASATAIYGARGANGVILITTKRAAAGKTTIDYDGYYSISKVSKFIPELNPNDYTLLEYERNHTDSSNLATFTSRYGPFSSLKNQYQNDPGVNWQNELFGKPAQSWYHKISLNSGSENTTMQLFYSYDKQQGLVVNSGAKKNIAKLSIRHKAGERLNIYSSITYSKQIVSGSGTNTGAGKFNFLQNILLYRPTMGLNGSNSDLLDEPIDPALLDNSGNVLVNPLINATDVTLNKYNNYLYLNTSLTYKLLSHLDYKGSIQLNNFSNRVETFNGSQSINAIRTGGPNGTIGISDRNGWDFSNTLTYSNMFNGDNNLVILVGQEALYDKTKYVLTGSSHFPNDDIGLANLALGALPSVPQSNIQDEGLFSLFGRINYTYKDKYLLTTSLRSDGSSKFGSANKFGYFPSAAFAWRIIQENFMKNQTVFSNLKLRLSDGASGNNRIGNYLPLAQLVPDYYPLNNNEVISVVPNNLPNPDLKWETTVSRDIGLDIGLFDQRVEITADYYNNKTKNLLLNALLPYISGYASVQENIGSTSNNGFELAINTTNINSRSFNWQTSFNISFNKNKVLSLTNGSNFYLMNSGVAQITDADYLVKVGQPVGLMYGYKTDGLYTVNDFDYNATTGTYALKSGIPYDPNHVPQPGFQKYKDVSGPNGKPDGVIGPDDKTVIGNANPKFFGGLTNRVTYKNFDLSIFINWVYGNDIYNANNLYQSQLNLLYNNAFAYEKNRWMTIDANGNTVTDPKELTTLNSGKTIPSYVSQAYVFSDRFVENGSFLRINNISLGYTIPRHLLSKIKVQALRFYLTVFNLYTFTNYTGYDPEVSVLSNPVTPGVDYGGYPKFRSFTFGVNASF